MCKVNEKGHCGGGHDHRWDLLSVWGGLESQPPQGAPPGPAEDCLQDDAGEAWSRLELPRPEHRQPVGLTAELHPTFFFTREARHVQGEAQRGAGRDTLGRKPRAAHPEVLEKGGRLSPTPEGARAFQHAWIWKVSAHALHLGLGLVFPGRRGGLVSEVCGWVGGVGACTAVEHWEWLSF